MLKCLLRELIPFIVIPPDRVERDSNFPVLTGPYLGQKPPGRTAELFAPDIIAADLHSVTAFSPQGNEVYWRPMTEEPNEILFMRLENGAWTPPQIVPFASRFFGSDDPCFSPDGQKLFFTSWRPIRWYEVFNFRERMWYVDRTEQGWSNPQPVGATVNSMDIHWQMSVSAEGTLYFASGGDIYRAHPEGDEYAAPERLDEAINTRFEEGHPFIAPDESYLLFSSDGHADNLGTYDLYISVREADGTWSEARNLGAGINSRYQELYPTVSPDGKYLFFLSDQERGKSVYWVDFQALEPLIAEHPPMTTESAADVRLLRTLQLPELGDLDGDGYLDPVFTDFIKGPNQIWINDGTGQFIDSGFRFGSEQAFRNSSLGDLDQDGDLDIFLANFSLGGGPSEIWFSQQR